MFFKVRPERNRGIQKIFERNREGKHNRKKRKQKTMKVEKNRLERDVCFSSEECMSTKLDVRSARRNG